MTIRIVGANTMYSTIQQDSQWAHGQHLLTVENSAAFACCGARCINQFGGVISRIENTYVKTPAPTEADLNTLKAEFLAEFLSKFGERLTYYGIVTSSQRRVYEKSDRYVLHLLLELGAKFVDERPNSVHGPNQLCMLVWCPYVHREKLNKYVSRVSDPWIGTVKYHSKFTAKAPEPVNTTLSMPLTGALGQQPPPQPRNPNDRVVWPQPVQQVFDPVNWPEPHPVIPRDAKGRFISTKNKAKV